MRTVRNLAFFAMVALALLVPFSERPTADECNGFTSHVGLNECEAITWAEGAGDLAWAENNCDAYCYGQCDGMSGDAEEDPECGFLCYCEGPIPPGR